MNNLLMLMLLVQNTQKCSDQNKEAEAATLK